MKSSALLVTTFTALSFTVPVQINAQSATLRPDAPQTNLVPVAVPQHCPLSLHTRDAIVRHTLRLLENPALGLAALSLEVSLGKSWEAIIRDWLARSLNPAGYRVEPPLAPTATPATSEKK